MPLMYIYPIMPLATMFCRAYNFYLKTPFSVLNFNYWAIKLKQLPLSIYSEHNFLARILVGNLDLGMLPLGLPICYIGSSRLKR
jgi:hypothetical protein